MRASVLAMANFDFSIAFSPLCWFSPVVNFVPQFSLGEVHRLGVTGSFRGSTINMSMKATSENKFYCAWPHYSLYWSVGSGQNQGHPVLCPRSLSTPMWWSVMTPEEPTERWSFTTAHCKQHLTVLCHLELVRTTSSQFSEKTGWPRY